MNVPYVLSMINFTSTVAVKGRSRLPSIPFHHIPIQCIHLPQPVFLPSHCRLHTADCLLLAATFRNGNCHPFAVVVASLILMCAPVLVFHAPPAMPMPTRVYQYTLIYFITWP
mmetsp:Transcript_10641/g.29374  ORF Transcript_10641/g.29374 Transcript_10641/m.29374 type:complete len:113 (-) Transcript_10641:840-1178(-)